MGNDSNIKEIRKQLRTVAKELLPEVLTNAILEEIQNQTRLELMKLSDLVRQNLKEINDRQRSVQDMIMRDLYKKPAEATTEEVKE